LGAHILLGNCLNLTEPQSVEILREAYQGLASICEKAGTPLPTNTGANRKSGCAVIKLVHEIAKLKGRQPYDTIRCAFAEGNPIYPESNFSTRLHIEICVINPGMIQSYFLPRPVKNFNPNL
jgi:hypothetical protein